jgi:hypothetical protein
VVVQGLKALQSVGGDWVRFSPWLSPVPGKKYLLWSLVYPVESLLLGFAFKGHLKGELLDIVLGLWSYISQL